MVKNTGLKYRLSDSLFNTKRMKPSSTTHIVVSAERIHPYTLGWNQGMAKLRNRTKIPRPVLG